MDFDQDRCQDHDLVSSSDAKIINLKRQLGTAALISLAGAETCPALHRAETRLVGEPSKMVLPLGGIREAEARRSIDVKP